MIKILLILVVCAATVGCATVKPADCGDNHTPVAVIKVK